jgi:DNA phosphorothioation-associated DGQHR protein 1
MIQLPIIEVKQPLGVFYITSIKASVLLQLVEADPYRVEHDGSLTGIQRSENKVRLREIANFLLGVESAMPNSIIIAGNTNANLEEKYKWSIHDEKGSKYLVIPYLVINGSIIDGQHRLRAFELIPQEKLNDFELLCSIYLDLPNPYQAYLFATININQKTVSRSLAYELYGYNLDEENPKSWSPEKVAVFLTRKMNFDKESIFYNHILVAAENDEVLFEIAPKEKEWFVSTASIVDGFLSLFSSKPKSDRDLLQQTIAQKRDRSLLPRDNTPLREFYLNGNDKLIFTIVENYFRASYKTLYKVKSYLFKTVGIQAQFGVLKVILDKRLKEDKDISERYFSAILSSCNTIDFSDNFYTASGLGKSRILNSILLMLSFKEFDEISNPRDLNDYVRLIRK